MKRTARLRTDPDKQRAWQQRGAARAEQNRRDKGKSSTKMKTRPKRNDGPWRNAVLNRRGSHCAACGRVGEVEIDHLWPRGQGGPSHVLNGLPLCGPYGCDAHGKKTRSEAVIEWNWLDDEQRAWLAEVGWVTWDDDGLPRGRGMRHFGPRTVRWPVKERVE